MMTVGSEGGPNPESEQISHLLMIYVWTYLTISQVSETTQPLLRHRKKETPVRVMGGACGSGHLPIEDTHREVAPVILLTPPGPPGLRVSDVAVLMLEGLCSACGQ